MKGQTSSISNSRQESVRGFILTRQWLDRDGSQELVYWLASEQGPARIEFSSQESVFFIRCSELDRVRRLLDKNMHWRHVELELKTFSGNEAAVACYFPSQKLLGIARSRIESGGISVYESDIRPTDRYLMERFITGSLQFTGELQHRDGFLDCRDPKVATTEYTPALKAVSIDIETSYTRGVLLSIAIYADDLKKVFMVSDESYAQLEYLDYCADEPELIVRFLQWFRTVDPDVIIGWSVVAFDLWFLQKRCEALKLDFTLGRNGETVNWRTASRGRDRNYALVPGRVVLDGIELLRTASYRFESFALDFVAREMLGRGKLVDDVDARASEIEKMYATDKKALAEYNLEDCALVLEIFQHTNLIDFAVQRSRLTGLDMDRAGGSVAAFDYLYLPRLHRQGFVAPVVEDDSGSGSPGGFVLDSNPGLYHDVVVLDFKSLYPSIIRTFHVDPLAMTRPGPDPIPGFMGGEFSRERYILPTIIEQLWHARDKAKEVGDTAYSQAIKIIMNSFYGVLGTPGCRFFDPRLVSSITLRGHEILKRTRDLIEDQGYPVIYGDTDSVFVLLERQSDGAELVGRKLTDFLNGWWRDHLKNEFRLDSFLEVEYETHFDRFLMPTVRGSEKGSKKRYAGMIRSEDGSTQLVFKGLETVRSDWSQLARDFQQELYRLIFLGLEFEGYIHRTVESVYKGAVDDKLVLRRRLRRKLEDYKKNVPPHVRAARRAEEIRRERGLPVVSDFGGSWVEYVMTLAGPEPRLYRESPIDYQFYVDKQLSPIANAILNFKSTSLEEITDRQLGLF
ncbi:MAG: DNA polymerase II [Gammaproteobacteria bacterium]|jgi:DNA polymerase-2|nr:DNA polymerase II [Gammaproteobacteria bacterium]